MTTLTFIAFVSLIVVSAASLLLGIHLRRKVGAMRKNKNVVILSLKYEASLKRSVNTVYHSQSSPTKPVKNKTQSKSKVLEIPYDLFYSQVFNSCAK
jgi:hypothetical protein